MREAREKPPLKARTAETLKSAPQAAFCRSADAAFQQLRQELREAAQDGQTEDRYESGKITETADHAVRQVEHLAEKTVHKLPRTKSEPQQKSRAETNPQYECPKPQQPAAAPREYPPVSAQPSYPPQVNRSVRESASPIREKPVPPASDKQTKIREDTPDVKTPVSPSQHPASRIHENARAVATETTPPATERSVREVVSPIKEKPAPPANAPQPKMREHTPTADAPVQQPQHPASQIQEKAVRVKEKYPPASAFTQTPAVRESTRPYVESAVPQRSVQQRGTPLRQETHGELSVWDERQNIPQRTEHPKDHPQRVPVREQAVPQKADTTHSALPEIKTKEYIRKRLQKQDISKRKASAFDSTFRDSETVLPAIRMRKTVREQQNLHVSHTQKLEQAAMPQIRTRQPQSSSVPVEAELAMPEIPQPLIPDIKSKRTYIAAQQLTQVTPVQIDLQAVVKQAVPGNIKLCQPPRAGEVISAPADKTVLPAKPVRGQKQARPAFVRKQKVKTAPTAKVKRAAPSAKALPGKMPAAAPKQAAIAVRKGQLIRNWKVKKACKVRKPL